MISLNRSSFLRSMSWLLPVLGAVSLGQACANRAEDCDANSNCPGSGGTPTAGTSPTAGKSGNATGGTSSAGDAGAPHAGANMNAGGGNTGGSTPGGEAGHAGAGGGMAAPCDGACSTPTPVCKEATDTCVECLAPADCTTGAEDKCDTTTNTCVECLETTDCDTATAARCDGGACVKCESNADCTHIAGKGVCDDGTCVQCTTSDESACAGKSCNPATKACTSTTIGSVGTCRSCVSDSECTGGSLADPDFRCVPMEFDGTQRANGFCLRRAGKTCARPYKIPIAAASLSGAPSESYCGINQDNVRCEAVLDLIQSRACVGAADNLCGCTRDQNGNCTDTGVSGLCRSVGVDANQCTYQCGVDNDCPVGKSCLGAGTTYCQ